jgi:hypothetical protein
MRLTEQKARSRNIRAQADDEFNFVEHLSAPARQLRFTSK